MTHATHTRAAKPSGRTVREIRDDPNGMTIAEQRIAWRMLGILIRLRRDLGWKR